MTVHEGWTIKDNRDNTTDVKTAQEALQVASPLPSTLLVDGGNYFPNWLSSLKFAISRLTEDQFRQQDFVGLVRQHATTHFHQIVERSLERFSDSHRIIVCWDNSAVVALAKQEVHQSRQAAVQVKVTQFVFVS
jgi:uncharacterized protein (DUF1800 family)